MLFVVGWTDFSFCQSGRRIAFVFDKELSQDQHQITALLFQTPIQWLGGLILSNLRTHCQSIICLENILRIGGRKQEFGREEIILCKEKADNMEQRGVWEREIRKTGT